MLAGWTETATAVLTVKVAAPEVTELQGEAPETIAWYWLPFIPAVKLFNVNVADVAPEIVSHNLETVARLTKQVRIQAKYERSLEVLARLSNAGIKSKSGIMLGLGETEEEIIEALKDLRKSEVKILTLGQYLQPTPKHLPVKEFIRPEQFAKLKEIALQLGFRYVESGPLVRSSYHAEKHLF